MIWKPITGYEGKYEISDLGEVRSLDRFSARGHWVKGIPLNPILTPCGHTKVSLYDKGMAIRLIHRLVWEAFVGRIPRGMDIDHINRIPTDNRLSNLRLATRSQNNMNRNPDPSRLLPRGVTWDASRGKFAVNMMINRKHVLAKRFTTLKEAAECRRAAERQYFKEFAPCL